MLTPEAMLTSKGLKSSPKVSLNRFGSYDLVVVGAGPGGYPAAIRAAQKGLKVAAIEKHKVGGTCLNVGCIPSKSLLNASLKFHEGKTHFKKLGINGGEHLKVNMSNLLKNKNATVRQLVGGIGFLFKKNNVTMIEGTANFDDSGNLFVEKKGGEKEQLDAKNVILAVGSTPSWFPGMDVDGKKVITSDHALDLKTVPKKMIVIGGGVIGIELGSVFGRLGSQVEVIEFLDRICPSLDEQIASQFQKVLTKNGFKFHLGTKVISAKTVGNGVEVIVEKEGKQQKMQADICLVSVGRKPNTKDLNVSSIGASLDRAGRIVTDGNFNVVGAKTKYNLKAIGDCIEGPMLAHKAEEDGIHCVDAIVSGKDHTHDWNTCPQVVYTEPEVAGVGQTEAQLKQAGVNYKVASFAQAGNSRSKVIGQPDGQVKLLYCPDTLKVLGGWILGASAGELIHEISTLMHNGLSLKSLSSMTAAHPTLSEAVKEAAMIAIDGACIHA